MREIDTAEWVRRRYTPPDAERKRRLAAEHEAAHATVAYTLGVPLNSVWIRPHTSGGFDGMTEYAHSATRRQKGAIAIAPSIWVQLNWERFPEGDHSGCKGDRRKLAELGLDGFALQEVGRLARSHLVEFQEILAELAESIYQDGRVTFNDWAKARNLPYRHTQPHAGLDTSRMW